MVDLRMVVNEKIEAWCEPEIMIRLIKCVTRLRNRKVSQVAVTYSLVMWFGIQACDVIFPLIHVSDSVMAQVALFSVIGLPISMLLAWVFEITPHGIIRDKAGEEGADSLGNVGLLVNIFFILSSMILAFFLVMKISG